MEIFMKKLFAGILTLVMLVQMSVFASELPPFDKDYFTYEETVTYSAKLNRDINFDLESVIPGISNFVDTKSLVSGLFDSESTITGKADISPDYRSGKIYAGGKSVFPFVVNKNLTLTADTNTDVWLEYDFSDAAKPVFKMVQNHPMFNKYITYDVLDLVKQSGGEYADVFASVMAKIMTKDFMDSIKSSYTDLLIEHADIKRSGRNYVIKIDDKALKAIINESVTNVSNFAESFMVSNNYMTKEEFDEYYNEVIPGVLMALDALEGIKILGDGGIVMRIECDGSDYIKKADITANVCVNIFDIASILGADVSQFNKDDGILDFTLSITTNVTKLSNVKVDLPALTEENSVNFENLFPTYPEYPAGDNECWHFGWGHAYCEGLPVVIDGEFYPQFRAVALGMGFDDCDITYDNGTVTIMRPEWVECGSYKTASFKAGENTVYLDGVAYEVSKPAYEIGDSIVFSEEMAKLLFRVTGRFGESVYVNFVDKNYSFGFEYKFCDHDVEDDAVYGI